MPGLFRRIATRLGIAEPARDILRATALARARLAWSFTRGFGRYDKRAVADYLGTTEQPSLYLGAGNHELEGWLNSDLYPHSRQSIHLDATEQFPFHNDTFRYVFSNHMIEHLTYPEGVRMLAECFRVLQPGGTLRVATPDFDFLLSLHAEPDRPLTARYIEWQCEWINRDGGEAAPTDSPIFVVNNFMRDWGHQFIYDRYALRKALVDAGFQDVHEYTLDESPHEKLRGIGNAERAPDGFVAFETMTMEAQKPNISPY